MPLLNFKQFKVLTFDCYGTLIDWETGILQALKPILEVHNIYIDDENILELYAKFESQEESRGYKKYRQILQDVVKRFGEHFNFNPTETELHALEESLKNWPPFNDTASALQSLKKKYRLAVISNIDRDLFAHSAEWLKVSFDWVITAEDVGDYKPSLKNFEFALQKFRVDKSQVLHVAQSLFHDIAPAKKLGLAAVWVNRRKGKTGTGATPPAEIKPDLEVPDLQTLVRVIES